MFEEVLAALRASSVWCGVPLANITRDQYRAAYSNGVHGVSDSVIRGLGRFETIRKAAAAQETFSADNAAKVYTQGVEINRLKREKKALANRLGQLEAANEMWNGVNATLVEDISYAPERSDTLRTAAAVAVLSDLHIEETVDPDSVEGTNSFDLCEAERRLERFFQSVDWLIWHHRTSFRIDTLVLAMIGDMISGYIHEDLVESNSLSPTEAVVWLNDRLIPGVQFLLQETNLEKIIIPCVYGNHGRTTVKSRIQTIHQNNLEIFCYDAIRRAFAEDERVEVHLAQGELLYLDVWDFTLRFHHGDAIRGGSGLTGPLAGAAKKVAGWDTTRKADRTICGHWHQYLATPKIVINGSLIGYGPYAQHLGVVNEPPAQAFFLIDSERGSTFDTPIWVKDLD